MAGPQEAVQVERDQREHLLAPLFHDLRLLLERAVDFAVHPPTGQRRLGGAEQHLVSKPNAPVNALVQIIAGQQLMLVEPAADALPLKPVMRQTGKCLVRMAAGHEGWQRIPFARRRCWMALVVRPSIFATSASDFLPSQRSSAAAHGRESGRIYRIPSFLLRSATD